MYKRMLILTIIIFLIGVSISPIISGISFKKNVMSTEDQDNTPMTFYTFEKTGIRENSISIKTNKALEITDILEELSSKIIDEPFSDETSLLKSDFIDLVDINGLIPDSMDKDKVVSLLDPAWYGILKNNPGLRSKDLFSNGFSDVFSRVGFLSRFLFDSDFFDTSFRSLGFSGALFFCNLASGGHGVPFPLFLLPRPRALMFWLGSDYCFTNVGSLISGRSFIAGGSQTGISVGFIGVGLTYSLLGVTYYGLIGYSLFTFVNALAGEWYYPPNNKPVISNENPSNGAVNVPVSLSELSFQISDADRDRMSYSVTTNPNIGSGTGNWKKNGFYSVPVSNLKDNQDYSWKVIVNDQYESVEKTFTFKTEPTSPMVSNPLPDDGDFWVPVDVSELSFELEDFQGDLMDYTVETSPNIGSDNGIGVDDGTYSIALSGLDDTTEYTWFVNVTDGTHWTREVFVFKTQPLMVFNPFDEGWGYRKKVTIDHDLVDGDLSDFPVLISVEDSDLRDKAQFDGDDILFMDGSGVANRLFHEIELYDNSDGEIVSWVKVNEIDANFDTDFYMYYGNPNCDNQEYPNLVWDSNFIAVYHMQDAVNEITDSTSNNKDSIECNGDPTIHANGIAGYSVHLDGTQDSFNMPDYGIWNNDFTIEAWSEIDFDPSYNHHLINMGGEYKFQPIVVIDYGSYDVIWRWYTDKWRYISFISEPYPEGWHYYVGTYDFNGVTQAFFDAESKGTDSNIGSMKTHSGENIVGANPGPTTSEWIGKTDEIRYSNKVRSEEWIRTTYNTINDPLNFISFSQEEGIP